MNEYEEGVIDMLLYRVRFDTGDDSQMFVKCVEDAAELSAADRARLRQIVWRYRHQLFGEKHVDERARDFIEEMEK